jgi:hypothetical protein
MAALPEVTWVQGSFPNTFEIVDDGMEVWMVMPSDLEDSRTSVPLAPGGGATMVTVLGGATSVTVKVLQWVLDEAAGGSTKVTEVTSWTDVTTDATSEEYAVPAKATLTMGVAARRFLKIDIAMW